MKRLKRKPLKKIIYSQDGIKKSRFFSFVFTIAMLLIIIFQYTSFILANAFILKSNLAILLMSVFLIFKPEHIKLWSVMGFLAFFVNLYVGGDLLAFFFYCSAILVLIKCGFFKNNRFIKSVLLIVLFFLPFFFQYLNFGEDSLKRSFFNILIVLLCLFGLVIMFADDLRKYFTVKETFSLSEVDLTERQKECFILASQGMTYEDIAKQIFVSESVVKKEMIRIYELINVKNKAQFLVFVEKYEIID